MSSQLFQSPLSPSSRSSLVPLLLSAIGVVSSAYLRLLIFLTILIPACDSFNLAFCVMYSSYRLNNWGNSIQPCCTLFPILNQSVVPRPVQIVASWPVYRFLRRQVKCSSTPISLRRGCCDTVKSFSIVNEADVFSGIPLLSPWSSKCWQFDLWFLYLFKTHLVH